MERSKLLILAVFVLAGCVGTQPVNVDANRGLTIVDFSANPSEVQSGELVLFDVEIENIGGTAARNVQIDFFGIEEQWRDSGGNLIDSTLTQTFGNMQPPILERGVPGDNRLAQIDIMTPAIPQGVSPTLSVEARASYDYNTSGFIDIPAVSEDEFRRKRITGQQSPFPITVLNSAGPIQMSMQQRFAPIRVDNTIDNEFQVWPLRVELTNVGDGFPITEEDDVRIRGAGGRIFGTIEILGPGAEFEDCLGETDGTFINLDSTDLALRLRETGSVPMACTIRIDKDIWNDRPEDSVKIIFNLFYRYYVSASANVRVIGR